MLSKVLIGYCGGNSLDVHSWNAFFESRRLIPYLCWNDSCFPLSL